MTSIKNSAKNKKIDIDKAIEVLINRAKQDIKADKLLSGDSNLKKDPLRLFLLQQASEKIIKAWFLKNVEVLKLLKLEIEQIKINKKTINSISVVSKDEKEKLIIIADLQESALDNYNKLINDAVDRMHKNDYVGFLKKLRHNPVEEYFIKILETLSNFSKFSLLIPDDIILKCTKDTDILKNFENKKDFLGKFIEFNDDIKKQLNIKNPKKIIEKLNLKEKSIKTDSKKLEHANDSYIACNDKNNINEFLESKYSLSIAIALVVFFVVRQIFEMNEDEQNKLLKNLTYFVHLYVVIPYFPLIAYLAGFENTSRYGDICNKYYNSNSSDIKKALVYIDGLHGAVENLIDILEYILSSISI